VFLEARGSEIEMRPDLRGAMALVEHGQRSLHESQRLRPDARSASGKIPRIHDFSRGEELGSSLDSNDLLRMTNATECCINSA
jgi:hypothetical protein